MLSDCGDCWDTPCTCGAQGYVLVYDGNRCASCYYAIKDETGKSVYCAELTVYDEDSAPCGQIQIHDKFYCGNWRKKDG